MIGHLWYLDRSSRVSFDSSTFDSIDWIRLGSSEEERASIFSSMFFLFFVVVDYHLNNHRMMRLSTYTSLAYQPTRQSLEEEGENQFSVFLFFAGRFSSFFFSRWLVACKGRREAELCDSRNEITSWLRAFFFFVRSVRGNRRVIRCLLMNKFCASGFHRTIVPFFSSSC